MQAFKFKVSRRIFSRLPDSRKPKHWDDINRIHSHDKRKEKKDEGKSYAMQVTWKHRLSWYRWQLVCNASNCQAQYHLSLYIIFVKCHLDSHLPDHLHSALQIPCRPSKSSSASGPRPVFSFFKVFFQRKLWNYCMTMHPLSMLLIFTAISSAYSALLIPFTPPTARKLEVCIKYNRKPALFFFKHPFPNTPIAQYALVKSCHRKSNDCRAQTHQKVPPSPSKNFFFCKASWVLVENHFRINRSKSTFGNYCYGAICQKHA